MDLAAEYGKLNIIEFLFNNGIKPTRNTFYNIITSNNLDILDFFFIRGIKADNDILDKAILHSNMDIIKYLTDSGYNTISDYYYIYTIADKGRFELIKYLFHHGILDTLKLMVIMIKYGHFNMVKYLIDNGVPKEHNFLFIAIAEGQPEIVKYLIDEVKIMPTLYDLFAAIEIKDNDDRSWIPYSGRVNIVKYLIQILLKNKLIPNKFNNAFIQKYPCIAGLCRK
jgi:ankyrin repeat protein